MRSYHHGGGHGEVGWRTLVIHNDSSWVSTGTSEIGVESFLFFVGIQRKLKDHGYHWIFFWWPLLTDHLHSSGAHRGNMTSEVHKCLLSKQISYLGANYVHGTLSKSGSGTGDTHLAPSGEQFSKQKTSAWKDNLVSQKIVT